MAAAPAPAPPHPAILMDELVEEFLLRLAPENPGGLARAALVSRQWYRVATAAVFRRRYREFHRSPPLLGYVDNREDSILFVSTSSSSFRPRHAHRRDVEAVHSSHGRILLRSTREIGGLQFFVWNPVTDKEWVLPVLVSTPRTDICHMSNWEAALVCAVGDGCSHLDCHFKVVFVGSSRRGTFSCFCLSEADSWSDRIFVPEEGGSLLMGSVLVGNALYFQRESYVGAIVLKYDLLTHQMCVINLQCEVDLCMSGLPIATEDGSLGFAMTRNSTLGLWVREQGRLAESRVIQLHDLLPEDALHDPLFPIPPGTFPDEPRVAAFADTGAGVIFLWTCVGYFTVDLNSGRSKKVGECLGSDYIVPYVSFCTPASGTVSTYEGPGASVVVATEGPGPSMSCARSSI